MPRNTYGDTIKKRVKRLLEALLDFVNYEFEGNFDIEFKPETEDITNPKVIFKTTLVALEQLIAKDKYPGKLKKEQIREALKLLENFLKILKDNRTKTQGSDDWHFTLTLWSKDREKNLKQFDNVWEDSRPEKSKAVEANFKKSDTFDWHNICLAMLEAEEQQRLTTNQLMRDDDQRFDLEEIHVPLALVERKKPAMHGEEILPEQGSRLYEPEYEEKQRFEHEQFLVDILKDGKGKHKGKRIAIIGEPGAGKTTLLRKIAFWVQENTEIVPISISLADLQEFTLEDYLLQVWLKTALKVRQVKPEMEDALDELFKSERVWLLLDGVDEMPVQGEEPLWAISNQLKGWVAQARVVLTCRLNVWEANRNVLADNFEIYRTLDFSYGDRTTPDRVEEFIAKWFNNKPNLGQELRQELDKPGKERIKDLAKNPLRLVLLCSTWNLWRDRGGLPDTKAKLYQGFVEKFYEWKSKEFPTTYTQQDQLNRALGELAKLAIDQTASRFRLKHSLVCQVLGKPDEGLFELALQLGWLNKVGLAAESPDETVYAFWHPTFEEYFAALAVGDRDFFLPRQHQDKPVAEKYRIFEPQWKPVILQWLGRENVESEKKEEFIQALVEFEDGIRYRFYSYRSYFLAVAAIAEFREYTLTDKVVTSIIKLSFGYYDTQIQKWVKYNNLMQDQARSTLQETVRDKIINELINLIDTCQNSFVAWEAAYTLGQIDIGNQIAVSKLVNVMQTTDCENTRWQSVQFLGQIGMGNEIAITALVQFLDSSEHLSIRNEAARSLGQITDDDEVSISTALQLLKNLENNPCQEDKIEVSFILKSIFDSIKTGNKKAVEILVKLLKTTKDVYLKRMFAESLGKIYPGNKVAIAHFAKMIEISDNEYDWLSNAYYLGKIDPGNETAIKTFIKIMENAQSKIPRYIAAQYLGEIDPGNERAVTEIIRLIESTNCSHTLCTELGQIGNKSEKVISTLVRILETTEDDSIQWAATWSLGKVGTKNERAIAALVRLIETTENKRNRWQAAISLGEVGTKESGAITTFIKLLEPKEDESISRQAVNSLEKIGTGNEVVIAALLKLIKTTQSDEIRRKITTSLKQIMTINAQYYSVVLAFKYDLTDEVYKNKFDLFDKYYTVIWHCAQNLPYPDFYQAWHQDTLTNSATASSYLINLPQFLAEAISDRPDLCHKVKLICIDSYKFGNPENPATKIYNEMRLQGCDQSEDGKPKTMAELQNYWDELRIESEIALFFICYDSTALSATPTGFSDSFLKALSKFDRAICVVCEPGDIPLQNFSPQQQDLVAAIVQWIEKVITEN